MAIQIYRDACSPCIQISRHAVLGNSISILFDVLLHSLQVNAEKISSISTFDQSFNLYDGIWLNVLQSNKSEFCSKSIGIAFQGRSHLLCT